VPEGARLLAVPHSWIVELRRKGLAGSTIRSAYTILRAVLDTAGRDGAMAIAPPRSRPTAQGDEQ
jgi:hypothetical protein